MLKKLYLPDFHHVNWNNLNFLCNIYAKEVG